MSRKIEESVVVEVRKYVPRSYLEACKIVGMEGGPICRGRDSISISVRLRFYVDTNPRDSSNMKYISPLYFRKQNKLSIPWETR